MTPEVPSSLGSLILHPPQWEATTTEQSVHITLWDKECDQTQTST